MSWQPLIGGACKVRRPITRLAAARVKAVCGGDYKRGRIHPLIHFMDGQGRPWQGVGVNAVGGIGSGKC